jgi:hypothetical protein
MCRAALEGRRVSLAHIDERYRPAPKALQWKLDDFARKCAERQAKRDDGKVPCEKCGDLFTPRGLPTHNKSCAASDPRPYTPTHAV